MAVTYEPVPDMVRESVYGVMRECHAELTKAEVTVHGLFARDSDKETDEPIQAVKRAGYPAAAKISVTSLADRARGIADAKLVIDAFSWERLSEAQRLALIDHELEHLALKVDNETGEVKRDDLGRPKLGTRCHDFELGFFASIAERRGKVAIEASEVAAFNEKYGYLLK